MKNRIGYKTDLGQCLCGDSLNLIKTIEDKSVNLIITSPPFALQRQKKYGNEDQEHYVEWFCDFARLVYDKLHDDGSFVVDLGGAYKKGTPVRSLYNYRLLIKVCDEIGFHLAEEFFWFNPSKLPSPIEWVNKRKIRVKDAVNTIWWFSRTTNPKADVRNILVPYSDRMKLLIKDSERYYKPKERPSGHNISSSFGKDNGGAIPPNLLQLSNSESNSQYLRYCKALGTKGHPARFPSGIPHFFIKFLTEENDLVVDIFSGSNTTGEVAEKLKRRWLCFDISKEYVAASACRFAQTENIALELYKNIMKDRFMEIPSRKDLFSSY